jgi:membrane fusion protein, multidrug efflux system
MAETSDPAPPNSPAGPDSTRKPSASSPTTGSSHWFAWLALTLVVGLASAFVWRQSEWRQTAAPGTPPPVPVVVARAEQGDIGDYVTGLGTVTPINTVEVRTRVDGQLMTVAYREGEMVRRGAPLVEIDPRPFQVQLQQAEAQLLKDQAALQNARIDLERYESLIAKNAIAQQILQTQRATVAQDEATLKTDQAAIDSAKLNLDYCHITAPISGRIGLRLVDPGNMVSAAANTPLLVITQTQPISVIFTIPEQQVAEVRAALKAGRPLRVDAMDRDGTDILASGELTTLDNQIDQTTGMLKLRATAPNRDDALFPNQFVNARMLVQERRGVTLIPNAAVQRNAHTTFVYVVQRDQTAAVRNVTLGTADAERSEVVLGISPNELVVIQGVDRLRPGSRVATSLPENEDEAARRSHQPPAGAVATTGKGLRGSKR